MDKPGDVWIAKAMMLGAVVVKRGDSFPALQCEFGSKIIITCDFTLAGASEAMVKRIMKLNEQKERPK